MVCLLQQEGGLFMNNSRKIHSRLYWLLLFIPLLLVACSPTKNLSKDEITSQVLENEEKVQQYRTEINLNTSIEDMSDGVMTQDNKTYSDITINEATMDSFGEIHSESLQATLDEEYYSIDTHAFIKVNDAQWEDVSSQQAEYFHHTDSFYGNLTPVVEIMSKMGELEETSDSFVLTFSGQSVDVYQAFETPYNLQFGVVEPKDINQEVEVVIDKDSFFINSIQNTLNSELSGSDLTIFIKQAYDHSVSDDEFSIPQEVIDEAKS